MMSNGSPRSHTTAGPAHIAVQDSHCLHGAFAEGRLYMPRRMLPDDYDIPHRYAPAPLSKAQPLLTSYTPCGRGVHRRHGCLG